MKNGFIIAIFAMCLIPSALTVAAQDAGSRASSPVASQKTGAPDTARYEVIQTDSNIKTTLKLDKYTGTVFQLVRNRDLVKNKDDEYAWEITKRASHQLDKVDSTDQVNYQIVTTTVGARYTFLVNINTGMTWKLSSDSDKEQFYWHPIKTQ